MNETTKKSTEAEPKKASESKAKKSAEPTSEKAASAQAHTFTGRTGLTGPTQDDLNPAYAPLTVDEE